MEQEMTEFQEEDEHVVPKTWHDVLQDAALTVILR